MSSVGTELLAHLLNKYGGDVNLAILAYHDGETKIDAYLAGIKNPALAQVQPPTRRSTSPPT